MFSGKVFWAMSESLRAQILHVRLFTFRLDADVCFVGVNLSIPGYSLGCLTLERRTGMRKKRI